MKNSPHTPKNATYPDAENKTSVRQLLDGQEYPVAKGDIIKKDFIAKLLLSDAWPNYMAFPKFLAVPGILVI